MICSQETIRTISVIDVDWDISAAMLSKSSSKLNVLVNKLHEYLAHSTIEDNKHNAASQDVDGLANRCSAENTTGRAVTEAQLHARYSRRKPSVVIRHSGLDESGDSNASESSEPLLNANGHLDVASLPKGTVLVQPEPADNGRDGFRGPEFCSRKPNVLSRRRGGGEHMEIVSCTACGRQINHFQRDSLFRHPVLKVLVCKACYKYYLSDDISKDGEGMDEQCRWCAEGGNLICCDFCNNAFCKKCILRNLGRKELSNVVASNWYCYVCNPEPLFGLVTACNKILENMESLFSQQRRQNRVERLPQNIPLDKWDHTGMDGNVIFNYSTLQVSKDATKTAKHLIDSTNFLNRTFVTFIHTVTNKRTPEVRNLYLNAFLSVVKGLRKSLSALEESLKEEFNDLDVASCWERFLGDNANTQTATEADVELTIADERCLCDLQKLAAEHLMDDDSNPKCFAEGKQAPPGIGESMNNSGDPESRLKPSESGVSMTKKLVVKLTPVTMNREPTADSSQKMYMNEKSGSLSRSEDKPSDSKMYKSSMSLHAEESGTRRSPRLKITPLRRPSDIKAKCSFSAANSDSDSSQEETSNSLAADNSEVQSLNGMRDNSDSDEVPIALINRAALAQSSDEPQSEEDGDKVPAKVAKKCIFWLNKSSPKLPEKTRRKRKLLDRSPESLSGSRRVKLWRERRTESSSDDQDSQEDAHCSREKPVKRGEKGSDRIQAGTAEAKAGQETTSSSSEDVHDDSSSDDQKIKPITEEVALMGAAAFHQSSGDEEPSESGPLWTAEDDDDPENRIAKKILLAQIKANLSSSDDMSWDEETQADESQSDGDREVREGDEKNATVGDGEDVASDSSLSGSCKAGAGHWLLKHKLSLDEGSSRDKAASDRKGGRLAQEEQSSDGATEDEAEESEPDDGWMSDEMSLSEGEISVDEPKSEVEEDLKSSEQKQPEPYILLSDSSEQSGKEDSNDESSIKGTPRGRRKIRRIIDDENLRSETQEALREEEERCKRLAEREQQMEDRREVFEGSCAITTKLILDQDEETKTPLVQVHRNLVTRLKPHQVDGVQFMWDCCCESVKKTKSSHGSGCILAHCMGLGKTLQVVTFFHTVLLSDNLTFRTALVVCPLNTVLNWVYEFEKWQRNVGSDRVNVGHLVAVKNLSDRLAALQKWYREGGVMVMGYELYRILSLAPKTNDEASRKELKRILVDPGPDFVVCDEGHMLRNNGSRISKALNAIKTRRRVVLTGTPLQNNLVEYHCMANFIKNNLLGSLREFRNRFINPIQNGQCADSTSKDVRLMKKRAHVLHAMLAGCVQRKDYSVLAEFLPPKQEYVLAVRITPLQYKLYRHYLDHITTVGSMTANIRGRTGANLFKDFHALSHIWNHPWCLQLNWERKEKSRKSQEAAKSSNQMRWEGAAVAQSEVGENKGDQGFVSGSTEAPAVKGASDENKGWFRNLLTEADGKIMEHSGKMVLLFKILRLAAELEEKVLVFSQSLFSLDLIETFLQTSHSLAMPSLANASSFNKNVNYFRIDGSVGAELRKKWMDEFNDAPNSRCNLLLLSTKAGSLGINLVAASRVVIFDASWNPSYDVQSIYRVYRFGQVRPVFIYRFLAQGTMEEKIYDRQVTKQSLSNRVVDQQQIERHYTLHELTELYTFTPDLLHEPNSQKSRRSSSAVPKEKIITELLKSCKDQIVSFHEHDSLLDHKVEEELSESERKAAWAEYKAESATAANPLGLSQSEDNLDTKTDVQLVELLNKTRVTVTNAFLSLNNLRSHSLEEYMSQTRQQYPHLSEEEVKIKGQVWKTWDEKEQERRRAFCQDVLQHQRDLTCRIDTILKSRRTEGMQASMKTVNQPGQT
eukprot:XP_011609801.1 PREDICTED: transcriptional regulator ATRX-like isoform X2 [Takifugu rubripes]